MSGLGGSGSRILRSLVAADTFRLVSPAKSPRYLDRGYHYLYGSNQEVLPSNRPLNVRFSPREIRQEYVQTNYQSRYFFSNKSEQNDNPDKKAEGQGAQEEVSEEVKALTARISELEEQSNNLLDKYKRSLADFENLRTRMNKQVSDAKIFGIQGFCKDLLEVADVMERAVVSVPEDVLKAESQYLRDMHQGLTLTQSQLLKVFERHGLVQENPLGEKFDPNKHDALFQIPAPDKEPNIVLDVQKVGYILQGRTIRPAAVGVSRK